MTLSVDPAFVILTVMSPLPLSYAEPYEEAAEPYEAVATAVYSYTHLTKYGYSYLADTYTSQHYKEKNCQCWNATDRGIQGQ